jgi:hypothetical protein
VGGTRRCAGEQDGGATAERALSTALVEGIRTTTDPERVQHEVDDGHDADSVTTRRCFLANH